MTRSKVEFTEGAEKLFKPVTTSTETVKTAIIGKPDPTDPDKPQQSLLQAIEQLKKAQLKPIKGFNYKTDFLQDFVNKVKTVPVATRDQLITFGTLAANAYHSREKYLKDPNQEVKRQQFLDGIFKIKVLNG